MISKNKEINIYIDVVVFHIFFMGKSWTHKKTSSYVSLWVIRLLIITGVREIYCDRISNMVK